jgi:hypothetical protein
MFLGLTDRQILATLAGRDRRRRWESRRLLEQFFFELMPQVAQRPRTCEGRSHPPFAIDDSG